MRTVLLLVCAIITLCVFLSCAVTDYVGKIYSPTDHVDIFFSKNEIKRPFEIMGKIRAEGGDMLMTFEQMEQNLVKEAMSRGADGIVIESMEIVTVGSTSGTYGQDIGEPKYYATEDGRLHREGGHEQWVSSTHTTQVWDKVLTAELIKYR